MPVERPCQPPTERGMAAGGTAAASAGSEGRAGPRDKPAAGGEGSRKAPAPHPPASDSEKDSGFSDTSSESLSSLDHAEAEEPSVCASPWAARAPRLWTAPGLDGSFARFAPVYIVKNMILNQPLEAASSTQLLAWSGQAPPDTVQGQARLLFLQQPVATTTQKLLLPGQKPQAKDTYLPILNAYPRIAPHPACSREDKAAAGPLLGSGSTGHAKSKRFCLEDAWVSSSESAAPPGSRLREERCPGGARPVPAAGDAEPLSQNIVTSSSELARPAPSPSAAQGSPPPLDPAEGRLLATASKKLGSSLGKQRRFHNTMEILRKSGLLGVTLRTKELVRQNSSTQREIAELREHTRLLCEAVQSNDAQAWARLQEAMSLSASYWARRGAGPDTPAKAPSQSRGAEAAAPTDFSGESLPSSPMSLALTPDLSVHTALP